MKISDYTGEDALDLLADIIEPAGKIMGDKDLVSAFRKNERMKAVKIAIKSHKAELIEIMARIENVPVEDFKCNIITLPAMVIEILNDPVFAQGFSEQVQLISGEFSGPAMESTEAKGK